MPEIKIKGIPQELIDKVNSLARAKNYPNRSAFVIKVLNEYCLYNDDFFQHCLPNTVKDLVSEAIRMELNNNVIH